ncbi:hypothetical protein ANME2D_03380 [Candidatus Methanoperedens nitroreducens]|uniref:Uncharacterized protein n=1 Tax=Candidatus Methanoperedens nitratireducens TaxID=1392998 RepID=A0A062V515_9EURY|nr:hypothetical protein ANME2D_03380 [Candidatus Methanoperedens nitroreducens]
MEKIFNTEKPIYGLVPIYRLNDLRIREIKGRDK